MSPAFAPQTKSIRFAGIWTGLPSVAPVSDPAPAPLHYYAGQTAVACHPWPIHRPIARLESSLHSQTFTIHISSPTAREGAARLSTTNSTARDTLDFRGRMSARLRFGPLTA
jgi:hypothetical protein